MNARETNALNFSKQLGVAELNARNLYKLKKYPKPDGIVIIGMGGSGLIGNILTGLWDTIALKVPLVTFKDYGLPSIDFKNPLFIFVSFSGNTRETLYGIKELLDRKNKPAIAVVTTDGELKNLAEKQRLPAIFFPAIGLTPRESLGYIYRSVIEILKKFFAGIKITQVSNGINSETQKKQARILAKKVKNVIPLIYTDNKNSHLGYIWKINFNETAKHPAFSNVIPEVAHGEIEGFEDKRFGFAPIFLKDPVADQKIIKKTESIQKLLKSQKIPFQKIKLLGKNPAEKTWNSIILSQLTSFYLAQIKKVDPEKSKFIDKLKNIK